MGTLAFAIESLVQLYDRKGEQYNAEGLDISSIRITEYVSGLHNVAAGIQQEAVRGGMHILAMKGKYLQISP